MASVKKKTIPYLVRHRVQKCTKGRHHPPLSGQVTVKEISEAGKHEEDESRGPLLYNNDRNNTYNHHSRFLTKQTIQFTFFSVKAIKNKGITKTRDRVNLFGKSILLKYSSNESACIDKVDRVNGALSNTANRLFEDNNIFC